MNARERFLAVMSFEAVDRTLMWEFGYWGGALRRWYREGLPCRAGVPEIVGDGMTVAGGAGSWSPFEANRPLDRDVEDYFGMDEATRRIPLNDFVCPAFEEEVLEDLGDSYVWRNDMGVVRLDLKDRMGLCKFLSWPVSNREDWERLKAERLRPTMEGRLPPEWPQLLAEYRERTHPLVIGSVHGFYGTPRYLLGDEGILYTFYDDPALMKDIIGHLADLWVTLYDQVLSQTSADVAIIWEDMSYKGGSLISPAMFREFMLPAYKKLTSCFRDHGVKHILVDTDGDCWKLIPLFLEGGVTGLYPFEVNAGMDVVEVRKAFPRLQILGGLDKMKVAAGPAEIDAELEKVPAILRQGGYMPFIDHVVPSDIPWEHFKYYRTRLNQILRETPLEARR